jgi:hypothetical protein
MFKEYQNCLKVLFIQGLRLLIAHKLPQVALKDRGVDKLVEEAREENKENDLKHLGPRSMIPSYFLCPLTY